MTRNPDYTFVPTDTKALLADMVARYEAETGTTLLPGSPERLFLQWVASIVLQERVLTNYVGNQNIPSRASGANLDALAELFYAKSRPQATPATCSARFSIPFTQESAVLIPAGTRVTDSSQTLYWQTTQDAVVEPGQTDVDIPLTCQTPGVQGNGFQPGQISVLVDLLPLCDRVVNTTASGGGSDEASDEEFYQLLRLSQDAYSTAGPSGGYVYYAKLASLNITDVVVNSPAPGEVAIFALTEGGIPADVETKNAILAKCADDTVRPLTDHVTVCDPEQVDCSIQLTYYLPKNGPLPAKDLERTVQDAVQQYKVWQTAKMGRDINPSYLIGLLMQTGIKRVDLTQPTFTALSSGANGAVPQVAHIQQIDVINGGLEDE